MEPRIILIVIFGLATGGTIWLEKRLEGTWLSLPMVYVALGWMLFSLPIDFGWLAPAFDAEQTVAVEYLTEMLVIISLVSLGLSIDRKFSWQNWKQVLPLLLVTMPLSIGAIALLSWWAMGLPLAAAILLGACLSPTDPVLARSVQVGPPGDSGKDDVRFNLSAEAGFNDSLAFPFVYLAIALTAGSDGVLGKWFATDVLWKIAAGAAVGLLVGKAGAWAAFKDPGRHGNNKGKQRIDDGSIGLLVVAALLVAYGVGELVNGYGFLSVFVAAVTAKQHEIRSDVHKKSHGFVDQLERVTLVAILVGFGALLASGVMNSLTWESAAVGAALLLIVRPLAGMVGLLGSGMPVRGRLAVSFLGIRGVGSFYYLAYGQHHADFTHIPELWATISFTVLLSVVLHGATASKILYVLGKKYRTAK